MAWEQLGLPPSSALLYWVQVGVAGGLLLLSVLSCLFFYFCICRGRGPLGRRGYCRWLWHQKRREEDLDVIEPAGGSSSPRPSSAIALTGGYTSMPQTLEALSVMPDPDRLQGCCFDESSSSSEDEGTTAEEEE